MGCGQVHRKGSPVWFSEVCQMDNWTIFNLMDILDPYLEELIHESEC